MIWALFNCSPAIKADVCICHVQQAGEQGTVRIDGSLTFDHFAVHAARKVIITAEQVVPEEYLRQDPNRNQIPCTAVDMVVEVPWGGHPGQVYNFYDMDIPFLQDYAAGVQRKRVSSSGRMNGSSTLRTMRVIG
ncbi:MAG: hypothetical protein ACOX2B_10435 [Syntrophothermaceae bacterium]